ncbi:MAG: fumarate hydratase [Candidatus Omnitrophica bacterium]|nr:fumarate hydratase [Candidatus Omnitrophota bacterium]MDD5236248.1 fumarate hydratase [Candidatus Omnitrophota bacterium]MDD5611034.1 fumarate hydratase [Candidatus Omnitrophota bacterium]
MRTIKAGTISKAVSELCIAANLVLRKDALKALGSALRKEVNPRAKSLFAAIIENANIAKDERIAICQDTGFPTIFVEIGQEVKIKGDLKKAINKGVELGYKKAYLRNSIIADPLDRARLGYTPCIVHIDLVKGKRMKISALPKGFGCENKSRLKMFAPTADKSEIKKFIVETIKETGPDACPPFVVGIGIGGTADYAMLLAKKALLRDIAQAKTKLGEELLREINKLNIGPMGLGGETTCLAVNILTYPTHIAGLPVAVNISCHALRSASAVI